MDGCYVCMDVFTSEDGTCGIRHTAPGMQHVITINEVFQLSKLWVGCICRVFGEVCVRVSSMCKGQTVMREPGDCLYHFGYRKICFRFLSFTVRVSCILASDR